MLKIQWTNAWCLEIMQLVHLYPGKETIYMFQTPRQNGMSLR